MTALLGISRGRISFSQVSTLCDYSLMLNRLIWAHDRGEHKERVELCRLCRELPEPPRSIALIFGDAIHAAIERYVIERDPAAADWLVQSHLEAEAAHRGGKHEEKPASKCPLCAKIISAEPAKREAERRKASAPIRWDDAPRMTKGWKDKRTGDWIDPPRPYKGDEKRMPDLDRAIENARLLVPTWIDRYGAIEVKGVEVPIKVPLSGELEGWTMKAILDLVTVGGGIVDLKATGSGWDDDEIDAKLDQAHLNHLAFKHQYGEEADPFVFHILRTGTDVIDVREVPYDEAAIRRTLLHSVLPTVRTIEGESYRPNRRAPFPHSEKWCDHWHVCPHGEAARGASFQLGARNEPAEAA